MMNVAPAAIHSARSVDNLGTDSMMTSSREFLQHQYYLHEHVPDSGNWSDALLNEAKYVKEEIVTIWNAPQGECLSLFFVVIALIFLDAFIAKKLGIQNYKTHCVMVIFWISCGFCYNGVYVARHGWRDGIDWFIGYVLEWMLSLDNLFAFQFIMRVYSAPQAIQHKALFVGVASAMVWRLLMFFAIGFCMHSIHYVQFLFGFILIYAGVQALQGDDEDQDPNELIFIRILKRVLGDRLQDSYDLSENHALFVQHPETGRWCATLLVPLIFCIEISDLIFAVDSVSAKVAQIPNQYIAYSSSVLAILGLRAMYFVVDDLVNYFDTLKYGVAFILVFIGCELMISYKFMLPDWIVCIVIIAVFTICILASVLQKVMPTKRTDTPAGKASSKTNAGASSMEAQGTPRPMAADAAAG